MPAFVGSRRALLGGGETFNGNPYSFYSLLDIFSDPRAAGAVNGTLPVVGGARVVTDTNSKLSIVGGVASFATGGVGAGDPGLWYPAIARALGVTLLTTLVPSATSQPGISAGWDTAAAGPIADCVRFNSGAGIQVMVNGTNIAVGTYSATSYSVAITLRGSGIGGCYYFFKGGAFTNWTLLWQSTANTGNPLPAIVGAATTVFTADNIRVPVSLYIPTPLAYDTFTRADGALGSTETVGPDGTSQVTPALAWTLQDGTIAIVSNKASLTVLGGDLLGIATVTAPSADVLIDCNLVRTLGSAGIVARYADASNYLRATTDGTNVLCEQVVAGTPTTLRTAVTTYGAGNTLRLILEGTTGYLFYNGAAVGASFIVPSSVVTKHGLYGSDLSATYDNFQVMARGTGGEYAPLNVL